MFRGSGDGTWTARDRAKALAYADYQRSICPQCGTRESDWVDETGAYTDAYVAVTHKCFGCEEIAARQQEVPEGKVGAGMKVLLLPAPVWAAQQIANEMTT